MRVSRNRIATQDQCRGPQRHARPVLVAPPPTHHAARANSSSFWTPLRPQVVDPGKAAVDAPPAASLLDPLRGAVRSREGRAGAR